MLNKHYLLMHCAHRLARLFSILLFLSIRRKPTINIYPKLPPQKSVFITYVLWLFGGFFGLHHLYLHRDLQAFLWWSTLGGYFGIGWLVDLFKIPAMVRDVNEDPKFIEEFINKLRKHNRPEFSSSRFLFGIMVGYIWSQLLQMAIPQDHFGGIDWGYLHWLIPLPGALGEFLT